MKYEVGDKVQFKNVLFIMDAEILEVYTNKEFGEFDYYIRYTDYNGGTEDVLVRECDLVGFTEGTKKYLKQELDRLMTMYSKQEIVDYIKG